MLEMLFSESRTPSGRPWVMLNMVESIDGATAFKGGASALNDPDDRAHFLALRAVADVVMMGAQTVRSENLGPVRLNADMLRHRQNAGIEGEPRLVILTRSLDLDEDHRVFSDQNHRPTILTDRQAAPERVEALDRFADVIQVENLDGPGIVEALSHESVILCEGGPRVNSQLVAANVVDEVNLTISPKLVLGNSSRLASGTELESPIPMRLDRTLRGDRSLFLRFVRSAEN